MSISAYLQTRGSPLFIFRDVLGKIGVFQPGPETTQRITQAEVSRNLELFKTNISEFSS